MAQGIVYILTLAVFIAVYALIAVRKVAGHSIPSHIPALIGGAVLLIIGATTPSSAWSFIRWDAILLLLGMMLMTSAMDYCGFFTIVAEHLEQRFPDRKRFLFAVTAITSFLCMIMLNDAVVLIFTPIVIMCCRRMRCDPVPFVIAVFTGANIGCAATFVGAPHCALAGSFGGISFLEYTVISVQITVVCSLVAALMVSRHFSGDLDGDYAWKTSSRQDSHPVSRTRMYLCLAILICMLALFATNDFTHIGLGVISMVGGMGAALVACTAGSDGPRYVAGHVNWGILLFFIGLFVLIAGVRDAGVIDTIADLFGMGGSLPSVGSISLFIAVLSNLISNVPAVMLVGEVISPLGAGPALWTSLALISSLGANLTIIGSAANIIGISEAEKEGIEVPFVRHLRLGIPLTAVTCIIATAYLYIIALL